MWKMAGEKEEEEEEEEKWSNSMEEHKYKGRT